MNQRQQFIQYFFKEIHLLDYTLLKYIASDITAIDETSDLDILLSPKAIPFIETIIRDTVCVESFQVLPSETMQQFFLFFKDGSFLQIDCLFQLIRKNIVYLDRDYICANTYEKNGVKTYTNSCLFEHLVLFNQLNFAGVPAKYIHYFEQLPSSIQSVVLHDFNTKYQVCIQLGDVQNYYPILRKRILEQLKSQSQNSLIQRFKNGVLYLKDSFKKTCSAKGKIITFSGVDGAGKSTILAETKQLLEQKYRKKVVVLRHRPSLFPILSAFRYGKAKAEQKAATRLPRQGNNTSKLASIFRFLYYYIDYLLGQIYIYFKYILRDYIVLYDRYYFDFIVDAKRSNIDVDKRLVKRLYAFIQKPSLNLFLYASPTEILKRKKELSATTITQLSKQYRQLFDEFSNRYEQQYLPIYNIDKKDTLLFIQKEIQKTILS